MQLTLVNFFKRTVPGHIFRGKRRLVQPVTEKDLKRKVREYELQEYNMSLLMRPYLTREQSFGHAKELGKTAAKIKFYYDNRIKPPLKPSVKIEDRLSHLRVSEAWD